MNISFIVPVYNAERFVCQCLESLYGQDLQPGEFEVIVVNDGSTDNSLPLICDFAAGRSDFIIVEQENKGVSAARNNGLRKARGRYVMFVDADDYLLQSSVHSLLNRIGEYNLDFIRGEYVVADKCADMLIKKRTERKPFARKILDGKSFFNSVFREEFYCWLVIFRRSFLIEGKLWFPAGISMCEDVYFLMNVCLMAKSCMYMDTDIYVFRPNRDSAVANMDRKKLLDFLWVLEHVYDDLKNTDMQKAAETIISRGVCMIAYCAASLPEKDRNMIIRQLESFPFTGLPVNGTFRGRLQVLAYNLLSVRGFILLKRMKDFVQSYFGKL